MSNDKFYDNHEKTGKEIKEKSLERFKGRLQPDMMDNNEGNAQLSAVLNEYLNHFESTWSYLWAELELGPYDPNDADAGKQESCKYAMGLAEYMQEHVQTSVLGHTTENPQHEFYILALSGSADPLTPFTDAHHCVFENADADSPIRDSVVHIAQIAEELKHDMCDLIHQIAQEKFMSITANMPPPNSPRTHKKSHLRVIK